jgi:short-subunit dehydrogenase
MLFEVNFQKQNQIICKKSRSKTNKIINMKTDVKYVLITGGTSGIGYELAKLFANDNYNLIIVARTAADLEKTAKELKSEYGVEVLTISKDLFNPDAAFEVYNEVKAKGIKVDILVNDAGQGRFGKFAEMDLKSQLDIIQLNVMSLVTLTHLFINDMLARGDGKILNLSSIASKAPGPWQTVYHGTKAFVQSFTEGLREEVKDTGVTLTALIPGATDTDFFRKANMETSKILQNEKLADPADVAKDGYKALMSGDDEVISGMKNKMQVAKAALTPDEKLSKKMGKQQEPVKNKK